MTVAVEVFVDDNESALEAVRDLSFIFSGVNWDVNKTLDSSIVVSGVVNEGLDAVHSLIEEGVACNAKTIRMYVPGREVLEWTPVCA